MCCHVPGKSMNLQSIITAPACFANLMTSPGFMLASSFLSSDVQRSDRVLAGLTGADADDLVDRGHEDLAVADAAGARGLGDGGHHLAHALLGHDDLELHLGHE